MSRNSEGICPISITVINSGKIMDVFMKMANREMNKEVRKKVPYYNALECTHHFTVGIDSSR